MIWFTHHISFEFNLSKWQNIIFLFKFVRLTFYSCLTCHLGKLLDVLSKCGLIQKKINCERLRLILSKIIHISFTESYCIAFTLKNATLVSFPPLPFPLFLSHPLSYSFLQDMDSWWLSGQIPAVFLVKFFGSDLQLPPS